MPVACECVYCGRDFPSYSELANHLEHCREAVLAKEESDAD